MKKGTPSKNMKCKMHLGGVPKNKEVSLKDINIGIDLGGSHVAIGVVTDEGKIIEQLKKIFMKRKKW